MKNYSENLQDKIIFNEYFKGLILGTLLSSMFEIVDYILETLIDEL